MQTRAQSDASQQLRFRPTSSKQPVFDEVEEEPRGARSIAKARSTKARADPGQGIWNDHFEQYMRAANPQSRQASTRSRGENSAYKSIAFLCVFSYCKFNLAASTRRMHSDARRTCKTNDAISLADAFAHHSLISSQLQQTQTVLEEMRA